MRRTGKLHCAFVNMGTVWLCEKVHFGGLSILSMNFWERMHGQVLYLPIAPNIVRSAVGEIEMIAEPKRKPHQDDNDRDKRERSRQEEALDEALKNTFPASDPVSVEQLTPPAADRDRAQRRGARFDRSLWMR